MVLLLLCNGCDPNLEPCSPLDLSLDKRRWDLVDLLLEWGLGPHSVDLEVLFSTYNSKLFERFRFLGIDLTAGHELVAALGNHTSNKALFGITKRLWEEEPEIQYELNISLAHHALNERSLDSCCTYRQTRSNDI